MTYRQEYRGMMIVIIGYWVEDAHANHFKWNVESQPLEGKQPYNEFNECYFDACGAIDKWLSQFEKKK